MSTCQSIWKILIWVHFSVVKICTSNEDWLPSWTIIWTYHVDFCKFKVFSNINRHIMTNCTSAQNTLWFSYQMSIDQMNSCLTKGFPECQWCFLSGCHNHPWGRYSSGHCNRNQDKFNPGDSRTYLENWNNYNSTNSSSATNCSIIAPNISYSNSRSSKILFTRYLNSW